MSRRLAALAVVAVLAIVALVALTRSGSDPGDAVGTEDAMVTTTDGVSLDTTLFVPDTATATDPAPAVLLAHGFGGSKDSVAAPARTLAEAGYVVLTWSARGFGASTGLIGLDSPDFEVADASALIDRLSRRPEVVQDAAGDPRVGITGASYGGALALLAAGYDDRVDAIVPQITWNSLATALFPNSVGEPVADTPAAGVAEPTDGVYKRLWAGIFFAAGRGGTDPVCGRFRPEVCAAYTEGATTGRLSDATATLLARSSPASVLDRITAPTLLVQGEADSLFPLSEADANARGIAAAGTPVSIAWYSGGHDDAGSPADSDRVAQLTTDWFDRYLRGDTTVTVPPFEYSAVTGLSSATGRATSQTTVASAYPGLTDGVTARRDIALSGQVQLVINPAGGTPASLSTLPGLTRVTSLVDGISSDVPGQAAVFTTDVLTEPVEVVGTPSVSIRVAAPDGAAVLFAKLYDVDADGIASLPQGLVAPTRLVGLASSPDAAAPVTLTLPAVAHRFEAGHRMRVVVASTDQAFAGPTEPVVYAVGLAGTGALSVPSVDGAVLGAGTTPWVPFLIGLAVLVIVALLVARLLARRRASTADTGSDVPLVITGLTKSYADGFVAVRDLAFTVEPGQVVGLLGPNGAGKTTTLRMLLGLIVPTAGELRVFGQRIRPGAPVLSRVGAFVEGTGFLPHLSGGDNLATFWAATGRPAADARVAEALEIAGLGTAIDKPVRTYSQGMRQRLAIAQAMLGLPDLLVLDEPTNGLDPPQIHQMRDVLRRYAADGGRTVLVSSHLLAEVEQTCSHVVVMNHGLLVTQGTVAEVVGESASVLIDVDDVAAAVTVLTGLPEVSRVDGVDGGVSVELTGDDRRVVVGALVRAGVGVTRVSTRRRLEDVFLDLVGS